jgi:hypothetical protein
MLLMGFDLDRLGKKQVRASQKPQTPLPSILKKQIIAASRHWTPLFSWKPLRMEALKPELPHVPISADRGLIRELLWAAYEGIWR